ncbi:O-antigen ligase family protein [Gordonia aurantiaca]|uniref:O-antigen ligase family protein n=1 Tax=Gordonia sp. B21 TaxID=3151852 RepID=UPI003265B39C
MTRTVHPSGSGTGAVDSGTGSPTGDGRVIQYTILALFAAYAILHAVYMAGSLPGGIYYVSFALLLCGAAARVGWLVVIRRRTTREIHFLHSFLVLVAASTVLVAISWIREFATIEAFTWTSAGQVFYILGPALIALCVVNTATNSQLDIYVIILLARYVLYFVLAFSSDFSLSSLNEISWSSSSSPFESSFAHDLLVVEAYFVFRNRRVLATVAAGMTMLSLKRASFVLAPVMIVGGRWLRSDSRPSRKYLLALGTVGVLSPFAVMYVYSPEFVQYAYTRFGVDVNTVTTGRLEIYRVATGLLQQSTGFGSLNPMLMELVDNQFGTRWNSQLHNDTLRVYLEVGLLGVASYVGALVYLGRSSRIASLLITYTFFVLITSRLITHTSYWVVLFLVLACIERWIHAQRTATRSVERSGLTDGVAQR